VTAVCIQEQPRRADLILSLVDAGKINLKSPLRYYGRLADEPQKLPWGVGYDIELSGVDYQGLFLPASGGLRLGYIARQDHPTPLPLHTGDSIAVVTKAKLPQVFRDEGAFNRRGYLSQQGVDLVGALRGPGLLELVKPAGPAMSAWISRGRRGLREEVDELWSKDARVAGILRAMLLGDRTFVDRDEARRFPENRSVSRAGGCGFTRGRNRCGAVLGRAETAMDANVDDDAHAAVAASLCDRRGAKNTGAACCFDGGDCGNWRIFLSAAGVVEFGGDCGVTTAGGKTVCAG